MAAIAHSVATVTSNQTTTSTSFVDVPGASLASGSFTAGKKYLLVVTAQITGNHTNDNSNVRMVHGSTPTVFSGSESTFRPSTANFRWAYGWFTVWTAVDGDSVRLQYSTAAANTQVNFASLLALNLSDDVVENTDWHFADRATDDTLTAAFLTGASITFTPAAAGRDWLVLSYGSYNVADSTVSRITRINRSGEASSTVPTARSENVAGPTSFLLARAFTLGAASNTFAEQGAESVDSNNTRAHSSIFAIDLHKFAARAWSYTEAAVSLSATNYATQVQTASITPTVTGDVWFGGYCTFDAQNAAREFEGRIQVEDADNPGGQTTANYQFDAGADTTDESPWPFSWLASLSSGAGRAIDLDGSADATTGTPTALYRTVWGVSMELAGAPPAALAFPFRALHPQAHLLVR